MPPDAGPPDTAPPPAPPRRGGAVLGSPIAHSLSPVLHRAAYRGLELTGWTYRAVECDRDALPHRLAALEAEGLAGVSLTMPLKQAVLPLLTRVERTAADVGAANTVLFGDVTGQWWGGNTDVPGMVAALRGAGVRLRPGDRPWVLGAGATAASALAALAALGATAAVVAARRPEAAAGLLSVAGRFDVAAQIVPWSHATGCTAAPLVLSTTPAGTTDGLARSVRRTGGVLFDVVYAPWPTRLAAAWSAAGGSVVGGLELLVEQAAEQVRLMTGRPAPVAVMREAVRQQRVG